MVACRWREHESCERCAVSGEPGAKEPTAHSSLPTATDCKEGAPCLWW